MEERLQQSRDALAAQPARAGQRPGGLSATAGAGQPRAQAATRRWKGSETGPGQRLMKRKSGCNNLRRELLPLQAAARPAGGGAGPAQPRGGQPGRGDPPHRDRAGGGAGADQRRGEGTPGPRNQVIALRRGDVVISSGQPLATAKVSLQRPEQAREVINALLQQANRARSSGCCRGSRPTARSCWCQGTTSPTGDSAGPPRLLGGEHLLSAANVLRGEQQVLAFPDLRPNRPVVRAGDVLATTSLEPEVRDPKRCNSRLNLLLAAAFAKVQRQGSGHVACSSMPPCSALARDLSERPGIRRQSGSRGHPGRGYAGPDRPCSCAGSGPERPAT